MVLCLSISWSPKVRLIVHLHGSHHFQGRDQEQRRGALHQDNKLGDWLKEVALQCL